MFGRRKAIGVAVLAGLALLAVILYSLAQERGGLLSAAANMTTDTRSADLAGDSEKLAFLQRYLAFKSAVEAAEFHLVYHDNASSFVPGPSDWDMQAALKIAPADLPLWSGELLPATSPAPDLAWGYALLPNEPRWRISSRPVVYTAAGKIVAAFEREGIVLIRLQTLE